MPTWGQLLAELHSEIARARSATTAPQPGDPTPFDVLRRKYLGLLHEHTGRAAITYETAWLEAKQQLDPNLVMVHQADVMGFMEAVSNISERELDLILHSPGGYPEATESIVEYLRSRFDHIRVFVPVAAMSAATMLSLAADEIVMGAHSQLGPIDPQFTISTPEGPRSAPAQAIIDQFELAKQECRDPANIAAWLPILRSYAPGLLAQCNHQRRLSEEYVEGWLARFMFKRDADGPAKAKAAAEWFADFGAFKSHGRRVSRDDARNLGLNVADLESDHVLQDLVLSAHHAVQHTLSATGVVKVIENHRGRAWLKIQQPTAQVEFVPAATGRQQGGARPPRGPNLGGSKKRR